MGLRRRDIADLYERRYVGFRNALAMITGSYESATDVVQDAFAGGGEAEEFLLESVGEWARRGRPAESTSRSP